MRVNIGKYPGKNGHRKIKVQIDRHDTYSLDHTLSHIIYPALLQLKATKNGTPSEFCNVGGEDWDEQDSFDFYKETHQEAFDEGCKRWDDILDHMIWAFEQLAKDNYGDLYHHGKAEYDWEKVDKVVSGFTSTPLYQMVDKNPSEHWYDVEGEQLHEDRIQEGIMLFAKYYRALWD